MIKLAKNSCENISALANALYEEPKGDIQSDDMVQYLDLITKNFNP